MFSCSQPWLNRAGWSTACFYCGWVGCSARSGDLPVHCFDALVCTVCSFEIGLFSRYSKAGGGWNDRAGWMDTDPPR
ncbi:hypothetical protein APED_13905 [Acanthopleuribacter pedis]